MTKNTITTTEPVRPQRLFFALWPTPAVAAALAALTVDVTTGRPMRLETLHLTLAFVGDVPASRFAALQACADQVFADSAWRAPTIALDRLDYWPRQRIVWAGCSQVSADLQQLADTLTQHLASAGFAMAVRPFVPHVSLLRNASPLAATIPAIVWTPDQVVLVRSRPMQGVAAYQPLRHWPLA